MSATEYTYNERDLNFLLFEQLKIAELLKLEPYQDFDEDDIKMIVSEAVKFAKDVIAPTNKEGDEVGAQLIDGKVKVPECYQAVYKAYSEGGWFGATGNPEYGGQGLPHVVGTGVADIFTGANTAFFLYGLLGVGVAHVLDRHGADWMKEHIMPKLYEGVWSGTMMLTEPSASSDVGACKTKAVKVEGQDTYKISGTKLFITGGDQDMSENIWHLVLARTPDAPAGTKGLSLFLVPKFRVDENYNDTDQLNDVACVGIEHKMGIKGSATCQVSLGDNGDCLGHIVGNEGDGIRIMFIMMNDARIEVGLQGCSSINAAYQYATAYAKERLQGSSIKEFKNPNAPKVPIIEHPDIRRQLLTIKAFGEGVRSLLCYTAWCQDMAHSAESDEDKKKYAGFNELLTPICKAYSTDQGVEMTSMAIQVLGGYGYTSDYPIEQLMRDVKIGCIYEGTNSIQSMDLVGRKLGMKKGMIFMAFTQQLEETAEAAKASPLLAESVDVFLAAKNRLVEVAMTLSGWGMMKRFELAMSKAVGFLNLMGDVVIAGELLKAGVIASEAFAAKLEHSGVDAGDSAAVKARIDDNDESSFYYGKVMSARFFIRSILPRTEGMATSIKDEDMPYMDMNF